MPLRQSLSRDWTEESVFFRVDGKLLLWPYNLEMLLNTSVLRPPPLKEVKRLILIRQSEVYSRSHTVLIQVGCRLRGRDDAQRVVPIVESVNCRCVSVCGL